jgi:hypothetical protein
MVLFLVFLKMDNNSELVKQGDGLLRLRPSPEPLLFEMVEP